MKNATGKTPTAVQQSTDSTPPKSDKADESANTGTGPAPAPNAIPDAGRARGSQDDGKTEASAPAKGQAPAITATSANAAGAPAKPVAEPKAKPEAPNRDVNSDTVKPTAGETAPANSAGTSTTPEKPEDVPLTEQPAGVRKPGTAAVAQESKEPAAPGEPKANEPKAGDPAVNSAAGTGERVSAEPASTGVRPKSEDEVKAPVEPAASTEPVEASAEPHSTSAQKKAGATGGTFAALMIVSFVLEVALLGALGIWAMTMLPFSPVVSVLIAVLPVFIFWALFMSPKANLRLSQPYHAVVAHLLFAAGSGLLAIAGQPVLAVCMGVLTAISLALTVAVRGQNVESRKKATGRRSAR